MWIIVEIGCLVCSTPSAVAGHFKTESEAQGAADLLTAKLGRARSGHHRFQIFSLPEVGMLNPEYVRALREEPIDWTEI